MKGGLLIKIMKTKLTLFVLSLLVISVMPGVIGTSVGAGIGAIIDAPDSEPLVALCGDRIVIDDSVQWGRVSQGGQGLMERTNNYAFDGEQIRWRVLVSDMNGIETVEKVYATVGGSFGGGDFDVSCQKIWIGPEILPECDQNAPDEWDSDSMHYYECTLAVGSSDVMPSGDYWVTVTAEDVDENVGIMAPNENWFFNPTIALSVDGTLDFEDVIPGESTYSETILVGNDADDGSGVMLDMFISGTHFQDSLGTGAMCPDNNLLMLENFRYFATHGPFSTLQDMQWDTGFQGTYDVSQGRNRDAEGYMNIQYGDHWDNSMYEEAEILQAKWEQEGPGPVGYFKANILSPGSEFAITFRLDLPQPCTGEFDEGTIYFWGEAI